MFDALSNSKPSRASVVLLLRFHYSQLDFRKCVKAPKTVPKWPDQLNLSSNATCVNSKSNLYSKSRTRARAQTKESNSYATLDALSNSKQKIPKWHAN